MSFRCDSCQSHIHIVDASWQRIHRLPAEFDLKMPRPKKVIVKKDPKEIRAEVRDYIKNERDTVLKKWMALEEQLFSEDTRKAQFIERRLKYETHTIPMNIQKFIGTLKRSVRKTIRDKGKAVSSIITILIVIQHTYIHTYTHTNHS